LGRAAVEANWKAASRVERVRKSAAAYLGKYMSKGITSRIGANDEGADSSHPSAWHGISRNLLRDVIRFTRLITGRSARECLSYLLANFDVLLRFNRWVGIDAADGEKTYIAWYGELVDPHLLDLVE
jgi:hypothetical protein